MGSERRTGPVQPVKSFANLEGELKPSAKDVIATYRDYAKSGAAINADVVIGIMERTKFSLAGINAMLICSFDGALAHHRIKEATQEEGQAKELSELREMDHYVKVANFAIKMRDTHKPSTLEIVGFYFDNH